jgi:alpha-L-rhamnosidase
MDRDMNIQGVANKRGQSYIRFELDISNVDGTENGLAKFNVYRVGYEFLKPLGCTASCASF